MFKHKFILSISAILSICDFSYSHEIKNLEIVTVNAQKQSENMQKVPIAMSVFNEFDIEDKGIKSISDIGSYVPNLMIFDIGNSTSTPPSIRGLFAEALTLESTLGVYVDGVPITMGVGINESLIDIERVEVLRGPQGSLYGKNTESGVINIITKQPSNETRANTFLSIGEDKLFEVGANVSGAIIKDKLYLGIGAKHYQKDGFVKHINGKIVDDREHDYARVQLRITPTDNLEISLIKSITKYNDGATHMGSSFFANRVVSSDLQGEDNSKDDKNALKINYTFNENLKFQSISTYRQFDNKIKQDFDFTNLDKMKLHSFTNGKYSKYSQEFRLNYEYEKLKLVTGIYFDKNKNKFDDFMDSFMPYFLKQELSGKSLGLFSHLDYAITDKLGLILGLRYDNETKKLKEAQKGIDLKNSYSEVSPKFSLKYNILPNFMTYFTVAKGYRAGGFNPYARAGYPKTYDKESLYSYDFGFKSSFFNDTFIINSNIYYMDIKDMQVTANIKSKNSSFNETYTSNAASAESYGLEMDMFGKITNEFSLFATAGLNRTKFKEFKDELGDYSGKYNRFSPKYNYSLGVNYTNSNGVYAQTSINGYGKMFLDKNNQLPRKAYDLFNIKIGYESNSFDIYLYANNVFDKKYDSLKYAGMFDTYSSPREIGLKIEYRY